MKIITPLLVTLVLFFTSSSLFAFSKQATTEPILVQSGKHKHWCSICGMPIKVNYKTSHTSILPNKKKRQYCSMRCLAVDMQLYRISESSIKVVDALSEKLLSARSAFYVVGSDVRGTMTKISKLAFKDFESAESFSIEHGGDIVGFSKALKITSDSLKSDTAMITKKIKKKMYPMGKKIFEKSCSKDIEPKNYLYINELKSDIKNKKLCKPLKELELQALSLYLWDIKRLSHSSKLEHVIAVKEGERCPVCGMSVYKYPKWVAQIFYGDKHYSFDGVKDMMKYFIQHQDGISKIIVTNYYTQKVINAKEAYYVSGSDVYGPMGDELIPFSTDEEAITFSLDHKGVKILRFNEITVADVNE